MRKLLRRSNRGRWASSAAWRKGSSPPWGTGAIPDDVGVPAELAEDLGDHAVLWRDRAAGIRNATAASVIQAMLSRVWLRPVSRHDRVGEHSAVVCYWVNRTRTRRSGRCREARPGAGAGPAAPPGAALVRNVARLVKPPEHTPRERETWSRAEVRKFPAKASSDRLYAAWRLSLYGLRRCEVLGLLWSDIDLRAGTLTVNQARVSVEYRVRIEEPKSRNGKRTLPLDGELVAALTALRKRQLDESTIAGAAYRSRLAELDWYKGGEHVITDEAGTPVHPEWYSDEFGRLLRRAGLPRITLHDSRHTTLTLS